MQWLSSKKYIIYPHFKKKPFLAIHNCCKFVSNNAKIAKPNRYLIHMYCSVSACNKQVTKQFGHLYKITK